MSYKVAPAVTPVGLMGVSGAQAASGAIDFLTGGYTQIEVDISVTSFTGGTAPTVTFTVLRLDGFGVFQSLWTSAALTGGQQANASIGPGCAVAALLSGTARLSYTSAGAPTNVTFSAAVSGR